MARTRRRCGVTSRTSDKDQLDTDLDGKDTAEFSAILPPLQEMVVDLSGRVDPVMPAPKVIFAGRIIGRNKVTLVLSWNEAERLSAGYHRDGIATDVYEVQIASYRRIQGQGDDAVAS